MNWLNKLERKLGRFAIPNLIVWLIGAYGIGFILNMIYPTAVGYLSFQPYYIFHGQVWRLVTWIFQPTDSNIFFLLIMMLFYYQLGTALERTWGTFRFNAYIFGGFLFTIAGGLLLYGVVYLIFGSATAALASALMGSVVSTSYVNMSIFLAFAAMYPNMQVLLYFIIPIKMKWMAIVYVVLIVFNVFQAFQYYNAVLGTVYAVWATVIILVTIIMSLLNFLLFFLSTRNLHRYSPHEVHRRQQFKQQMREPRPGSGITKHKCAVCGRTELDDPSLEFRFCSKCEGNYEYCQHHLFTHQHIRRS